VLRYLVYDGDAVRGLLLRARGLAHLRCDSRSG
jgi:hypothetical protein